MEFNIGTQFSREFSFEETSLITNRLNDSFNSFFKERDYGSDVKKTYIGILCVSKGFEPFFIPKPLKVLKKDFAIEYELKVDFETIFKSNIEERIEILYSELLNQSKEIINSKKIKNFDSDKFLNDFEKFTKLDDKLVIGKG